MIELQRCNDKQQWDDFIIENGGHPLQLWSWGQVKADSGWKVERFFGSVDGENCAAAEVLFKPLPYPFASFAYIPRGPLLVKSAVSSEDEYAQDELTAQFLDAVAAFAKREYKSIALSVEPDTEVFVASAGWVRSANKVLSPETILLDLHESESSLLAVMAKKTRQYIRKSAADVSIRQARSAEDIERCLELYKHTAQRAGFNLHSAQYYQNVFRHMQEFSPVFIAYEKDEPVAFLWLAISGETAYELYGGVNERGQELRANYALKWHAIRKMKEWGLGRYDFGGLVAGGVTVFKQGWSENVTVLAGTFDRPLSPLYRVWSKGLPAMKKFLQKVRKKS